MAPNNDRQDRIWFDFYEGAYGPTVRINISSQALLKLTTEVFSDLAKGRTQTLNLCEVKFVNPGNVELLRLVLVEDRKTASGGKTFRMVAANQFVWSNSSEGWTRCAALLEALDDDLPGHQYLTLEEIDDALVEVSYLER